MKKRIDHVAAAMVLTCGAMGAAAQSLPAPISPDALLDRAPIEQRAHLKSLMPAAAPAWRSQGSVANADTTRPALTAFNATRSIDVAAQGARLAAAVQATDDESGIDYLWVSGRGPHNQRVSLYLYSTPPSRRLAGLATARENTPFHEPGEYVFTSACVYDLAGNGACYDEAGLSALGQNRMTVINRRGHDVTPPTLVRGRVLTPWISLSQPHPGTTEPAFAGVELELQDAGDSALAGASSANGEFCKRDLSACFSLPGYYIGVPRAGQTRYRTGTQLPAFQPTGEYRLAHLTVYDYAGMERFYQSVEFGGDIDFSAYFPSISIHVRP